jgi:uncharacterized membrane protein YqjE
MEPNTIQDNNVHQLYPDRTDTIAERESWGNMVERLTTDMSMLWDRQSQMIVTELDEKITTLKTASVSMVSGGVLMFVGLVCLAVTCILALSNFMQPWIAAGLVTVVLFLVGIVMLKGGQKKLAGKGLVPEQSIEALGEIKNTFRERIYEFKRS